MKRELKFRAWSNETKKMMDWQFIKSVGNLIKLITLNHVHVMQFTGLLDKNGKEIYEGDVVKRIGELKYTFRVEYIAPSFWLHVNEYDLRNQILEIKNTNKNLEVIGNIYENPTFKIIKECI